MESRFRGRKFLAGAPHGPAQQTLEASSESGSQGRKVRRGTSPSWVSPGEREKCAVHRIRGCSPPSLWEHWGVGGTAGPPRLGLSLTARAGPGYCLPWVPEKGVRSTGRSSGIPTAERNFRGRGLLPKEQKRAELTPNRPSCEKMLFYIGFKYNFIFLMEIIQKALWGQRFPGISHD